MDTRVTAQYLTHIYAAGEGGLPEQPTKECRPAADLL